MVGKVILWILIGIIALLLVLLLIPVKIRGSYREGEPFLLVRYGPVRMQLFPPKEKSPEDEKKPSGEKKRKPAKAKKEKAKKPKAKINTDQILYALETLPPILGRALKRTGRSIHIRPLQLYILAAGPDPAAVGLLYGKLDAALAAGFSVLEKVLRIKDADVRLYVDFTESQMDFIADVGVSLRPASLVWMALRAGGSLLKWFIGFRRLASPPPEPEMEKKAEEKPETEHEAA